MDAAFGQLAEKLRHNGLNRHGSTGKLVLHILGAIAEFERDLILQRARAGLAAARQRGKRLGPPIKWRSELAEA